MDIMSRFVSQVTVRVLRLCLVTSECESRRKAEEIIQYFCFVKRFISTEYYVLLWHLQQSWLCFVFSFGLRRIYSLHFCSASKSSLKRVLIGLSLTEDAHGHLKLSTQYYCGLMKLRVCSGFEKGLTVSVSFWQSWISVFHSCLNNKYSPITIALISATLATFCNISSDQFTSSMRLSTNHLQQT